MSILFGNLIFFTALKSFKALRGKAGSRRLLFPPPPEQVGFFWFPQIALGLGVTVFVADVAMTSALHAEFRFNRFCLSVGW